MHGGSGGGTPIDWTHPGSWPFFLWLWLGWMAFIFVGTPLWKRWQKMRGESWPVQSGTIAYGHVEEKNSRGGSSYEAQVFYDYTVNGERYSDKYTRGLDDEEAAEELVRDLNGRPLSIHVNPANPAKSWVSDADVDLAGEGRPPRPEPIQELVGPQTSNWRILIAAPLALLSLVGLALSLWIHIGAILGKVVVSMWAFGAMHIGIFVVFFPAVFTTSSLGKKDWVKFLQPDEAWLKNINRVLGAYTVVNFIYGFVVISGNVQPNGLSPIVVRTFSGHWMFFYFASFGAHYVSAKYGGVIGEKKDRSLRIFDKNA